MIAREPSEAAYEMGREMYHMNFACIPRARESADMRSARGAEILDRIDRGWHGRLRAEDVRVWVPGREVLDLLYPDLGGHAGCVADVVGWEADGRWAHRVVPLGFCPAAWDDLDHLRLTIAWRHQVRDRQEADELGEEGGQSWRAA